MFSWLFFERYLFSVRAGSLIKKIAWLSIVSIAVAVMAFILVLSIMTGLHQNINYRIMALEPHLTIEFEKKKEESEILNHKVVDVLKSHSSELNYQLYDRQDVILRTVDGIFHWAVARGVTTGTFEAMLGKLDSLPKQTHAAYSTNLEIPVEDEIIIGSSLAKQMNLYEGDYVTVLPPESLLLAPGESPIFSKVQVKQIVSTNISDLDSQMVLFQRGKALVNFSKVGSRSVGLDIWMQDPFEANALKEKISSFKDLKLETWRDRNSAVFLALRLEKLMLGSFLGLSALITLFSIWSVLSLLIVQKRKEMGLLMAIGFSNYKLKQLFQTLGFYLAGIGVGVGSLIGILVGLYIEENPLKILPDIYYDSEVPAKVEFGFLSLVLVVTLILIYLTIRLSMNRVLSIKPSEALKSIG